ncbi:hypothetical protein LXL04_013271 [Taraxacum kok-saghyz]
MELKVPPQEPGRSPSVSETNPTEKEISDDDDDDRNHKHRRRDDARSQSLEGDNVEQVFTNKPYRRTNKSFENSHIYREPGSHSNDTWKNYNFNPTDKRRQGPSDLNQKYRDPGPMRGRGNWNSQHEFASRIVQQGSVPVPVPGFLPGRGLPTVSNAYGPSWSAYGLVPGIPNGGIDTLHTLGLQGTYRAINPSMNMGMGLPRQRCRDFEEQGFCLRGDMCPMEHGVNRIVVEDVQSLSQFNLPVSLQNTNLPGPPAPGAQTTSFKSSRGTKTTKRGVSSNVAHDLNDGLMDSAPSIGADFYDPDQPLWGNDSQTSPALQLNQSNLKETGPGTGPLLDPGPSGCDENTPKLTSTKNRTETKDNNTVSKPSPSNFDTIEKHDPLNSGQISKRNDINGKNVRRPNQKAQRTVFVSGIPLQQNKKETLISHFCKFGEVVDIHIPVNNDRAFVQFSKREEAEAALKAPDAVMGNRFIRLYWANRDNIPINGTVSGYNNNNNNVPIIPPRPLVSSTPTDLTKPVMVNSPKAKPPPPSQKKLENLEVLKEELRKKQEMLDQKRNDFRRKLDKLAKQATGVKGEMETEQVAKRQKLGTTTSGTNGASKSSVALRPLIPIGQSVVTNRFKLDNRPTAFKIVSPLPNDLASVAVLKEHFSSFGDFSKVELDDVGPSDGSEDNGTPKVTACVYFMTRNAAEKAFVSGKSWNGHSLQFSWLKSSNQSPLSTSKGNSDGSVPVVEMAKSSKSGDEESEKVEQMEIDKERTEPEESIELNTPVLPMAEHQNVADFKQAVGSGGQKKGHRTYHPIDGNREWKPKE